MDCQNHGKPSDRQSCDNVTGICECKWPYAAKGDFSRDANLCEINFDVARGLWALATAFWLGNLALCIVAALYSRRKTTTARRFEWLSLFFVGTTSCLTSAIGILQVTASNSGDASIGIDPVSTILFCIANTTNQLFLTMAPLNRSGTGVSPYAMERTKQLKRIYTRLFPFVALLALTASFMPLGILFAPNLDVEHEFKKAFYSLHGALMFVTAVFVILTLFSVRRDLIRAMRSDYFEKDAQAGNVQLKKETIEKLIRRTGKLLLIASFGAFCVAPGLLCIGLVPCLLHEGYWFFPALLALSALWTNRYLIASILVSRAIRRLDSSKRSSQMRASRPRLEPGASGLNVDTSTRTDGPAGGVDGTVDNQDGDGDDVEPPKRPRRKLFRLKGIKQKPLKAMSVVQEADYEGTVLQSYISLQTMPKDGDVIMRVESSNPGHKV